MVDEAYSVLAGQGISAATDDGDTAISDTDGATDILYREYQRVAEHFTRQFEYILRVAGIGFSAAAAVLYLVTSKDLQKHEWVYWVAPFGLSMLYSILIDLFYNMTYLSYYIRDLEDDIASRARVPYFHFHNSTVRGVASFRGGHPPRLANYLMILLFGIGIYVGMIVACMIGLQWEAHAPVWRQILFLSIQGSIGLVLIWSAWGTTSSLRERYERWKTIGAREAKLHIAQSDQRSLIGSIVSYAILPRRLDFMVKAPLTVGAALIAAWCLRVPLSSHLLVMLLAVVICVEFLAKQATYIWNEILDLPADRSHAYKKNRRVLARIGDSGAAVGRVLFVTRAFAAIVMSLALSREQGLMWLPWLVAFIFTLQFIYDRWAKRAPVRRLWVASIGYAERAVAGMLVVMTVAGRYDPVLLALLGLWIVVLQFSTLAHLWWAETWYLRDKLGRTIGPDPSRSDALAGGASDARDGNEVPYWFTRRGVRAEWAANILLFFVGALIAFVYGAGAMRSRAPGPYPAAAGTESLAPPAAHLSSGARFGARLDEHLQDIPKNLGDLAMAIANWIASVRASVQHGLAASPLTTHLWVMALLAGVGVITMVIARKTLQHRLIPLPKDGEQNDDPVCCHEADAVTANGRGERRTPAGGDAQRGVGATRSRQPPPGERVNGATRFRITVALALAAGACFLLLPVELWLYVVAVALPLLLAANFEWLTYDELNGLDKLLNEKANHLLAWLGAGLFSPWAVRISIAPVGEDRDGKSRMWAEGLRDLYARWAQCNGLGRIEDLKAATNGDGGYACDLIIRGHEYRWRGLLKETGIHVKQQLVAGSAGPVVDVAHAWVNVIPLSVPTRPPGLGGRHGGLIKIALGEGEDGIDRKCPRPATRAQRHVVRQRSRHPVAPLAKVSADVPIPPEAQANVGHALGVAAREQVGQGGAHIGVFRSEPVQAIGLAAPRQLRLRPGGELLDVGRVPVTDPGFLAARRQLLQGVLAHGFEHAVAHDLVAGLRGDE